MMRRAIRFAVVKPRALGRVLVVQTRFAETSAKEDRDDSGGGNSGRDKSWKAWILEQIDTQLKAIAWGSVVLAVWTFAWDQGKEWWYSIKRLDELLTTVSEPDFEPRDYIKAVAEDVLLYTKEFQLGKRNVFLVLVGPKGVGKTTAVEYALGGKWGTIYLDTTLADDTTQDATRAFRNALTAAYGDLEKNGTVPEPGVLLKAARVKCEKYKQPLVIYWKVSVKGKRDFVSLERIAEGVAESARSLTYDHPEKSIAVIIETSNPVLASLIPKKQSGCNEVIYVDSMNFDDFVKAAETDSETGRYIEKKLENGKVQQGLQTDDLKYYYSCFGGNLREMRKGIIRPLLEEYKKTKDVEEFRKEFRARTADAYEKLADTYLEAESSFSDDEKKLCELIARQGPGGLRTTLEQKRHVRKIRERNASMDILREQDLTIRLHRMAHARCILAKDEENTVSPKAMEEYGWLPKTDKAGSA